MHPHRILFYKDLLKETTGRKTGEYTSCMLTSGITEGLSVGSPCLMWTEPFELSRVVIDGYPELELLLKDNKLRYSSSAKNLFDAKINPWVVSEIFNRVVEKIYLISLFASAQGVGKEYFIYRGAPKTALLLPTKPIIYDEGETVTGESLKEVFQEQDLRQDIAGLKQSRYRTHIFSGVSQSTRGYALGMISRLIKNLSAIYGQSICFRTSQLKSLIDTIVVSFYRLEDMIAVFDKSKKGVGVEIYLTSNAWMPGEITEKSCAFRFLFSESRENIFTIDGEQIKRPTDTKIGDAIEILEMVMKSHLPDKVYDKPAKAYDKGNNHEPSNSPALNLKKLEVVEWV